MKNIFDPIINLWLPIGAIIISLISLYLSLSKNRFYRKYEAAKKRSELVTAFLNTRTTLKSKQAELLKVKEICKNCPSSLGDNLCKQYEQLIKIIDYNLNIIAEAVTFNNPIKIELLLTKHSITHDDIAKLVNEIDEFILKCKNCEMVQNVDNNKNIINNNPK
jgi:hypothetical protein